jgi:hypothetical protein
MYDFANTSTRYQAIITGMSAYDQLLAGFVDRVAGD